MPRAKKRKDPLISDEIVISDAPPVTTTPTLPLVPSTYKYPSPPRVNSNAPDRSPLNDVIVTTEATEALAIVQDFVTTPLPLQLSTLAEPSHKAIPDRLQWNTEMEIALFTCLLDQDRDGQRADSGWKSKAWERALTAVLAVTPDNMQGALSVSKLKTKESHFKGLYRDWNWLLNQSGFGIHPLTQVITAGDEAWQQVIQDRKSCAWHRHNPLPYSETLEELYCNSIATGNKAVALAFSSNIDPSLPSSSSSTPAPTSTPRIPFRNRTRSTAHVHKRLRTDVGDQLKQVHQSIRELASARNPCQVAVQILQEVYEPLLEKEHFDMALDILEDEARASMFVALKEGATRDRWLERKAGVEIKEFGWDLNES